MPLRDHNGELLRARGVATYRQTQAFLGSMVVTVTRVKPRWVKNLLLATLALLIILFFGIGTAWFWLDHALRSSLPGLSGTLVVSGPQAEIRIERDALGIPTIRAAHRNDLAFGLGFVHAQDRFFQMDAIRRTAAGELAELVGPGTDDRVLKRDRSVRIMRFRRVAQEVVANLPDPERLWLDAYVEGVNTALGELSGKPFEYLLLGASPAPWKPEDSVLTILAMYLDLQGKDHERESALGVARDVLPGPLAEFLCAKGSPDWDAPVQGGPLPAPPIPSADAFDLRREPAQLLRDVPADSTPLEDLETLFAGSNNWAVAGERSRSGGSIIANDMHLRLGVPTTWYRAALIFPERGNERAEGDEHRPRQVTGATLPGGPAIVVGSNGKIAWGLTNSAGDWSDLIELDVDPADPDAYHTPDGKRSFEHHRELIKIKGRGDDVLDIRSTIWGPVIGVDHKKRPRACAGWRLTPKA